MNGFSPLVELQTGTWAVLDGDFPRGFFRIQSRNARGVGLVGVAQVGRHAGRAASGIACYTMSGYDRLMV